MRESLGDDLGLFLAACQALTPALGGAELVGHRSGGTALLRRLQRPVFRRTAACPDGLVTESRGYYDVADVMAQLGLTPLKRGPSTNGKG